MVKKLAKHKGRGLMPLIMALTAGFAVSALLWHLVIIHPTGYLVQALQRQIGANDAVEAVVSAEAGVPAQPMAATVHVPPPTTSAFLPASLQLPTVTKTASRSQPVKQPEGTHHTQEGDNLGMVIATGANAQYFQGLKNMVGSVHYWCQECSIVVFNLGLTAEQVQEVRQWCRTSMRWRDGIEVTDSVDMHVKEPKQYAWKPFAILQAVNEHAGKAVVMWIDAGSTITGPLMSSLYPLLVKDGHLLMQGESGVLWVTSCHITRAHTLPAWSCKPCGMAAIDIVCWQFGA